MLLWLRRLFVLVFFLLAFRYRAYLLDTESQLLYGVVPLFLASFFLFEKPIRAFRLSDGLLLAFLAFFGLSCFFAQQPFGFFEFTTFFVGALVYYAVRFLKIRSAPFAACSWQELFVWLGTAFSVFALLHFSLSPTDRLSGLFHGYESYTFYPNAAALLLLAVLPFNVELSLNKQRFWYGALFLNMSAFLLTFSRGAYLVAMACGGLALLFFVKKLFTLQGLKKMSLLGLSGLLALSFAFGFNFLKTDGLVVSERLLLKDDAGFASVSERVDFWKGAWQMTVDNPWVGVGPGGFGAMYPAYQENWLAISDHPHNVLLKISSESGLPAALLFAGFLALIGLSALRRLFEKPSGVAVALFLGTLGLLGHNLIDYNLNFTTLSFLFFVSLALLENGNATKRKDSDLENVQIGFYVLSTVALLASFVTLWQGAGLVQARQMEDLYRTDPESEVLREYLESPPTLPFEMNHFELEGTLSLALGEEETLDAFLARFEAYADYHRWLYFKTRLDSGFAPQLLEANPKNEMEYHALYYEARSRGLADATEVEALVRGYTGLLSKNAHMTLLSQNPKYTEELCELYEGWGDPYDTSLDQSCALFDLIWEAEIYKFNQRYGTQLTRL